MFRIKHDFVSYKNNKTYDKPNEDLVFYDESGKYGMVLDGVSRDRVDGIYPIPSLAKEVTEVFWGSATEYIKAKNANGLMVLKQAVSYANDMVKEYNRSVKEGFTPGAVGIVFCIENDFLNYCYLGDCYAAFIRNNRRSIFTECQTQQVHLHKKEYTSDQIRYDICNHIEHPCGYGVWNGNEAAMDFVKYGQIRMIEGDVILFFSDGLENEVMNHKNDDLVRMKLYDLFPEVGIEDSDDRTILRLFIEP